MYAKISDVSFSKAFEFICNTLLKKDNFFHNRTNHMAFLFTGNKISNSCTIQD